MRFKNSLGLQNPRDLPYPSAPDIAKLGGMEQQPPQEKQNAETPSEATRPKHDLGQKRLFSHRRMMADLLRLLPDDLPKGLDLGTLRRLPAEHVGDALRDRRSDMPWRLDLLPFAGKSAKQLGGEGTSATGTASPASASSRAAASERPGTCLVLAEFQSRVDPGMAERMLEYAAMLRRDLTREGKVRGPGGGPPPLLPLVVYNGRRPWTAPLDLGGNTESLSKELAAMQPRFKYVLLEVRRFHANALALGLQGSTTGVNFALAQFGLENASAEDLPTAMAAVARQLKAEDELDLAESFGIWVEGVLEPMLGVRLPSMADLMEEPPMLAETLDEWAEEKFRQGQMKGLERERALLLRLTQRRFGADVSEALSKLLKGVEDPDRLTEVGDWVVDCATGRELLKRAGVA